MAPKTVVDTADDLTTNDRATTASTANDAPEETTPELSVDQWKQKYEGLRGTVVKYQRQAERLNTDLLATRQEFEDTKLTLEQERDQLRTRTKQLEQESTANAQKAATLEKRQNLSQKISQEFPTLTTLFAKGFLVGVEDMEGEAQVEFLAKYAEELTGLTDVKSSKFAAGATPPPAPPSDRKTPAMTPSDAWNALEDARIASGYGSTEYNAAYQRYVEMIDASATAAGTNT